MSTLDPKIDKPVRPSGRGKAILMWCVALGIIFPGGYGFVGKFIQFIRTLNTEEAGGFTIVPIVNYLLVAGGFICLLAWAVGQGMFRDVERPKFTMLEREKELDRQQGHEWSESS